MQNPTILFFMRSAESKNIIFMRSAESKKGVSTIQAFEFLLLNA